MSDESPATSPKLKRTKSTFPATRIKRIIQRGDEIGKVTKDSPILISRCIELFIKKIVEKSSEIAISKNSKTISPAHLRECLLSDPQFEFLSKLANKMPTVTETKKRSSSNTDEPSKKKAKRTSKKSKKQENDEEDEDINNTLINQETIEVKPSETVVQNNEPIIRTKTDEEDEDYDNL